MNVINNQGRQTSMKNLLMRYCCRIQWAVEVRMLTRVKRGGIQVSLHRT